MEAQVDVAAGLVVVVSAVVDDGGRGQPAASAAEPTGSVRRPRGVRIRDHALRDDIAIDVEAADLLVEIEKLLLRDRRGIERFEPVLDAHVVERTPRKPGLRVASVDHGAVIPDRAASAFGVVDRVIPLFRRQPFGAALCGVEAWGPYA